MTTYSEEIFLYEPFGKGYILDHPCYQESDTKENECWLLKDTEDSDTLYPHENEVYVNGCITVWSSGPSHKNGKQLNQCFTAQSNVKQVELTCFTTNDINNADDKDDICLCIVDDTCLTICSSGGSVYTNSLPFKVKRIWQSFNGLCIERKATESELTGSKKGSLPTIFTQSHPLDDMKPVVFRQDDSKKCSFFTDAAQQIVHTSNDPPLIVTYDITIGVHSFWKPRKTTSEDQPEPLNVSDVLPEFGSISFAHQNHIAMCDQSRFSVSPLTNRSSFSPMATVHQPSPIKPVAHHYSFQGNRSALVPSISYQSPNVSLSQWTFSPRSEIARESPRADTTLLTQSIRKRHSSTFRPTVSESLIEDLIFEPLPPDICFDFVWEENADVIRYGSKGMADQVFLTADFVHNSYLCMLVKYLNRLRLLKTNADCSSFSWCKDLQVKDAGCAKGLNVFVTLTMENELIIFSGPIQVCKLDLVLGVEKFGLLVPFKAPFQDMSKMMLSPVSGLTAQISALSTSTKLYDSIFGDGAVVSEIRDSTKYYTTLVLNNGKMLRMKVPALARSSFVLQCMKVIVSDIQESTALKILSKLFIAINSKQPQFINDGNEWNKLVDCLLQLMGFPEHSRRLVHGVETNNPSPPERKKPKKSESLSGSEEWNLMLESEESKALLQMLPRSQDNTSPNKETNVVEISLTMSSPLYEYIPSIFAKLTHHYEEMKLDIENNISRQQLGNLISFLAMCLGLEKTFTYFKNEAKDQYVLPKQRHQICTEQLAYLTQNLDGTKMHILDDDLLRQICSGNQVSTEWSDGWQLLTAVTKVYKILQGFVEFGNKTETNDDFDFSENCTNTARQITATLLEAGFTRNSISRLPFGIALPIIEVLHHFRYSEVDINAEEAELLGREDIALLHVKNKKRYCGQGEIQVNPNVDDGMNFNDEILRMMFSQDLRVDEVKRLLQSAVPVIINLTQKPEVSDYEFVREQEACLMVISKRTMALPVGRGMFSLGTSYPSMSETLSVPVLEMTGKVAQSNKTVSLAQMDLPGDLLHWPSFHNGVAAGLKVASGSSHVNSTWIVYNKLKYTELTEEHAGFLMALGLTGHLSVLPVHQLHDYLIKGHDLTSVALLIGMAATRISTMDATLYRLLSLHMESLLPPTALELGIPHAAHVAAIVAVGLLFAGSRDSHLVRVLLNEINRPPGPEMENAVDRESHALAAGIALGMIMLGKGTESPCYDINIGHELYHYVVGGERRPLPNDMKEKYRVPSHVVKEENMINTDVTAPSAIVALALMYLKTNNRNVAGWLKPSDTVTLLETVKPDHLLLKIMARNLIMWDYIIPSDEWINLHLAEVFKEGEISSIYGIDKVQKLEGDLDMETVGQCHSCIIAGCCMAIGLKFAGSFNKDAFDTLIACTKHFRKQLTSPLFEKTGHSVVEMCLVTSLLSLAMVMAGSGNLDVLRIARQLHKRCSSEVTYGSHMAVHMAIGLLFLGGGRYTLTTSNLSVAVLLCATYPKFPGTSRDNRYHLQALRHLYVLACEPRLLIPRDIDSRAISYAPINVTLNASLAHPECTMKLLAPCFIPELHFIKKISICGPRYWPVTLNFEGEDISKEEFLQIISCLLVKKKAGYLPYGDDPKGFKNLMARTFSGETNQIQVIRSFNADPSVIGFAEFCCQEGTTTSEPSTNSESYSKMLFDCVTEEKLEVLNIFLTIEKVVKKAEQGFSDSSGFSQIALVLAFYEHMHPLLRKYGLVGKPLIDEEFVTGVRLRLRKIS